MCTFSQKTRSYGLNRVIYNILFTSQPLQLYQNNQYTETHVWLCLDHPLLVIQTIVPQHPSHRECINMRHFPAQDVDFDLILPYEFKKSYFVGINPQLKKELFEVCIVWKNISWYLTEVEYCKIRLWFTSNITCGFISSTFYDLCTIFQKIIELTYYTIFFSHMNEINWTMKNWIMRLYQCIYILFIVWSQFALS